MVFSSSGHYRRGPSTAFQVCENCMGRGFLRAGDFADRTFPRCPKCGGIGQIYLEEAPPVPSEKS